MEYEENSTNEAKVVKDFDKVLNHICNIEGIVIYFIYFLFCCVCIIIINIIILTDFGFLCIQIEMILQALEYEKGKYFWMRVFLVLFEIILQR